MLQDEMRRYALADSPDEPGAAVHRFRFERIDPSRGTGAGYIAKYVAKNIDGFGNGLDEYGRDASDSAERTCAWAATWRIRQFSFFGTPCVTVYRELRRLPGRRLSAPYAAAHAAADAGDWRAYMEANPGVGAAAIIRPVYGTRVSSLTGECGPMLNAYGEPRADIVGVRAIGCDVPVITRDRLWRMERRADTPPLLGVDAKAQVEPTAISDLDLCQ